MVSSSIWPPFASSDFFGGEASREATRGHGTFVCVATLVAGLLECGVKKSAVQQLWFQESQRDIFQ